MRRRWVLVAATAVVVIAAATGVWLVTSDGEPVRPATAFGRVVPAPVSAIATEGVSFTVPVSATIITAADSPEAAQVGEYLADLIGGTVGAGSGPEAGALSLLIDPAIEGEAYELDIAADGLTIRAGTGAGLFWGVQTLRQLMPARPDAAFVLPGGRITDQPRFAYRGVMLDVARHFFDVAEVQRLVDLAALYKVNYLHLHLSDDQGWRIEIEGWPRLTSYGGGTEVGDGSGGYFTASDYQQIVAYAASRFMTVVPEIDLPGHTNAALASYPELNCDGVAPPRYTGINVGFSALCPTRDETYTFLADVIGELAAATPGPYLHIGGDEAPELSRDEYTTIVTRAQELVAAHGKTAVGWHDLAGAQPSTTTVLQFWGTDSFAEGAAEAAAAGNRFIMSPANRAYLDQKYDRGDPLGLSWAGPTTVEESYDWDPAQVLSDVEEASVLGVEAPLWTETVTTVDEYEYLVFPRLAAIAEIGWSQVQNHDWSAFRQRLGAQAPLWTALDIDFARVDGIPWATA
ncbi:MAG TPA: beta-N-acetylhexosaminidase [Jiangellales bacterium]|nr:beta-N-acetylhexosaminidase [Jiangellales bacterium]